MKTQTQPQPMSVTEVEQRLADIADHRARLIASRQDLQQRLDAMQGELSRRYLQGDRSGIEGKIGMTAELEILENALTLLAEDERLAQHELQRAQVRELQAKAEQKREELDRLNEKTAVLLSELSELEECTFTWSILSCQPIAGRWVAPGTLKPNPDPWLGFWEGLIPQIPGQHNLVSPRSRLLRKEIEELLLEADAIQQKLQRAAA